MYNHTAVAKAFATAACALKGEKPQERTIGTETSASQNVR